MKKILFVANLGKEHILKFHIPTIQALKHQGWCVDVACAGDDTIPYCDNQYKMLYKRSPFNLSLFRGIIQLWKIIRNNGYDIVYCHTPVGGIAARLASCGVRHKGTRVIYCAHGYHFYKGAPFISLLYRFVEKVLSWFTDVIITINKEDYEFTVSHFKKCKAYMIDGIGANFSRLKTSESVDSIRERYRNDLNISMDAVVLIYVADLIKNKNQEFLLKVLKELKDRGRDVHLVLVGIDHTDGFLEAEAKRLRIYDDVSFLGWRSDIGNLYRAADICVPCSVREGFGLNIVEAMYCGIPVVASNNRGHASIITDGVNGFLIDEYDVVEYADKISELLDDGNLYNDIVSNSLDSISKYEDSVVLDDIMDILEENCGTYNLQ